MSERPASPITEATDRQIFDSAVKDYYFEQRVAMNRQRYKDYLYDFGVMTDPADVRADCFDSEATSDFGANENDNFLSRLDDAVVNGQELDIVSNYLTGILDNMCQGSYIDPLAKQKLQIMCIVKGLAPEWLAMIDDELPDMQSVDVERDAELIADCTIQYAQAHNARIALQGTLRRVFSILYQGQAEGELQPLEQYVIDRLAIEHARLKQRDGFGTRIVWAEEARIILAEEGIDVDNYWLRIIQFGSAGDMFNAS